MFALRFASEKGQPVTRPLFAKVTYTKPRWSGTRTKGWKLSESPEGATQWATKEAAERVAAEFSSTLYEFAVEEV